MCDDTKDIDKVTMIFEIDGIVFKKTWIGIPGRIMRRHLDSDSIPSLGELFGLRFVINCSVIMELEPNLKFHKNPSEELPKWINRLGSIPEMKDIKAAADVWKKYHVSLTRSDNPGVKVWASVVLNPQNGYSPVLNPDNYDFFVSPPSKIEEGDVVRLKSGGPKMTVVARTHSGIKCIWFTECDETRSEYFNEKLLAKHS